MGKKNKQKPQEIQERPNKPKNLYNPAAGNKILLFGLPLSGFIIICFIWFEIYKPKVQDEWFRGVILVDSANQIADPLLKKKVMDEGGSILRQQINLHPYHARVWYLYGHYFLVNNNWDSCIYAQKKAIELGAGGVVNQIEYRAAEELNYALERKLSGIQTLDSIIKVIDNATTKNFENNMINKFKGFAYYNHNQVDSCNLYLERFYVKDKKDFNVLSVLAYNYFRKGVKDKALFYAYEAKKNKNDDPGMNNLINQINSR